MQAKSEFLRPATFHFLSVFMALLFFCPITAANAGPDALTCQKLEAQLSGTNGAVNPEALRETLKIQRIELAKVRGQAAAMKCLPNTAGNPQSQSSFSCESLLEAISTMKDNLAHYEELAKQETSGPADHEKLLAAWQKNGCDGNEAPASDKAAENHIVIHGQDPVETGSVIELGGSGPQDVEEPDSGSISHIRVNLPQSMAMSDIRGSKGSYITMCVRTCDGYYFPASYTSGTPNFGNDSDLCRSRCPGADTKLYYYSVPGQDTRDMVSLSGTKYMDQPFALKYRKRKPGEQMSCSCTSTSEFSVIGGNGSENEFSLLTGSVAANTAAPDTDATKGQDGDFAMKVREALTKTNDNAKAQQTAAVSSTSETGHGRVRVVGPKFFPDPKEGAILRSPGPNPGQ